MRITAANVTITALTMITAGALGLLAPVTAPSGWWMLAAVTTGSSLVLIHYRKRPVRTMSQAPLS